MPKRILLISSSSMELIMNLYRVPNKGESLNDDGGVAYIPGGSSAFTSASFVKMGNECALCTKLGADAHGQRLYNFYKESSVNVKHIKVDHDYPTGFSVEMRETDGGIRRVIYPGANNQLNSENILSAFDFQPDAIFFSLDVPFSIAVSATKIAKGKGIPVFVNASPASKEYPLENLPEVEIFALSDEDAELYTGTKPTTTDSCLTAAYSLFTKVKCKYVVIKLGIRGAFVYDGKHCNMIPAIRPDKVVDTVNREYLFYAAMCGEYLSCGNITAAVAFASAATTLSLSKKGSSASAIPEEEEVREFIRKRNS